MQLTSGFRNTLRALLVSASAMATAQPAMAEQFSTADRAVVVTQTCDIAITKAQSPDTSGDLIYKDKRWRTVPTNRLAFFLAAFARQAMSPDEALRAITSLRGNPLGSTTLLNLRDITDDFMLDLAADKLDGIKVFGPEGKPLARNEIDSQGAWMLRSDVTLRCEVPDEPESDGSKGISLRLRGNTDALPATGTELRSADAATFGYNRVRTFQDDGSRTQSNEFSVNGVLGAVKEFSSDFSLTAYVGYQLKRTRTRPAPALTPPATERGGDTDLLTIGTMGEAFVPLGNKDEAWSSSLRMTFSGSYMFDFVTDSERFRGEFTAGLFYRRPIDLSDRSHQRRKPQFGICDIGGYSRLNDGLWTRCDLQAIVTVNQVTKHGTLTPSGEDQFGHAGGKASFSLYLGDPSKKSSLFFAADYLYLSRYAGDPASIPNVRRHSVTLGHRWWQPGGIAVEIKASLLDGINPESFADENALTLGFGLIF